MISDSWSRAVDEWVLALRAAARPASTVRLRRYQVERVARGLAPLGPWEVTGAQLRAWVGGQDWQPDTRRSWRSALRGFYGWAHAEGLVDVDPSRALPAVKATPPCPRPVPEDAYRVALARADDRVRLMLRLAAELGMRRGEVAQLHATDLERDIFGWTVLVHGKGGKLRRLPVEPGLASAIRRAALMNPGATLPPDVGAAIAGYVFPGAIDGHISPHWCGKIVARALPGAWSMHKLRHRFATVAYAHDRDLLTVQELLGHASSETTRRYVQVPREALRRTVAAVAAV